MSCGGDGHGGRGVAPLVGVDEPLEQRSAPRRSAPRPTTPRAAPGGAPASSRAPAAARCSPRRRSSRAATPSRPPASRARPGRSAPRAGAAAGPAWPRGTRARSSPARRPRASGCSSLGADLVQQPVRVRLQPRHLGERAQRRHAGASSAGACRGRRSWRSGRATARNSAPPSKLVAAAPGPQQRLLHGVLGLVERRRASGSSGRAARAGDARRAPLKPASPGRRSRRSRSARSRRVLTSCSTHVLPSGSLKSANEP